VLSELGQADLGDKRRTQRLVRAVSAIQERPTASLPEAAGSWSETKALYRFLSNGAVAPVAILEAHRAKTMDRVKDQEVVLCVQDTTSLNFDTEKPARGLGPIGTSSAQGLYVHSCLTVTADGTPQGLLWWKTYARENGAKASRRRKKCIGSTPIEEKESYRWVEGVRESARLLPTCSRVVNVMDREGDMYEVFEAARSAGVDVLVRSCYSRRLKGAQPPQYLWDEEGKAPLAGILDVRIPRKPGAAARVARLHVRYAGRVQLRNPKTRQFSPEDFEFVEAAIVFAREENPPPGQEPIIWRLITTLSVDSFADATRIIRWYSLRWRIEEYHLTLKSGCRIERLQLEESSRIERALVMYAITAWHILFLTYEARVHPEALATTAFTSTQVVLLSREAKKRARPAPVIGPKETTSPLNLRDAVRIVACMGGFLARRSDGEPGVRSLWKGFRALEERVEGFEAALASFREAGRSG
jgi:hypothetical protein